MPYSLLDAATASPPPPPPPTLRLVLSVHPLAFSRCPLPRLLWVSPNVVVWAVLRLVPSCAVNAGELLTVVESARWRTGKHTKRYVASRLIGAEAATIYFVALV